MTFMLEPLPENDEVTTISTTALDNNDDHRGDNKKEENAINHDVKKSSSFLEGVLFGRSVRSTYASLNLVVLRDSEDDDDDDDDSDNASVDADKLKRRSQHDSDDLYHVLVRLQFDTRSHNDNDDVPDDDDNSNSSNSNNMTKIKELRSYFRRYAKHGDLLRIYNGRYENTSTCTRASEWKELRYVVHTTSVEHAKQIMTIQSIRYWTQYQWQYWHTKYYFNNNNNKQQNVTNENGNNNNSKNSLYSIKRQQNKPQNPKKKQTQQTSIVSTKNHHSGGLEKRKQGEYVANFLLNMIIHRQIHPHDGNGGNSSTTTNITTDTSSWSMPPIIIEDNINDTTTSSSSASSTSSSSSSIRTKKQKINIALQYLNAGIGVLDCAGGSGHVSMNLSIMGIQSTIIDPRENIGHLPGKDRKIYKRAIKNNNNNNNSHNNGNKQQIKSKEERNNDALDSNENLCTTTKTTTSSAESTMIVCQPIGTTLPTTVVRPFSTYRAWFGSPPSGVDIDFRLSDNATNVPICDSNHDLIQNCSAIVALHPDEATDAIVDIAVTKHIPFVIVPCCVFCRLFPNRRKPTTTMNNIIEKKERHQEEEGGEEGTNANKKYNINDVDTMVSTYQDLLDYLQAKHPSIQRATLPFTGANTVLYSSFP